MTTISNFCFFQSLDQVRHNTRKVLYILHVIQFNCSFNSYYAYFRTNILHANWRFV